MDYSNYITLIKRLLPSPVKKTIKNIIKSMAEEVRIPVNQLSEVSQKVEELKITVNQLSDILQYEGNLPPPPPRHLQMRVVGEYSWGFISSGYTTYETIEAILNEVGESLKNFRSIYDFGCGCGRIIRAFRQKLPECKLYGSDIDGEAISWLQKHCFGIAEFYTNPHHPPMEYKDNIFDFLYSISIFTHLPEKMQFEWLKELQRVTRCRGYLLITTHGEKHYSKLDPFAVKIMKEKGFYYLNGHSSTEGLPAFYQTSFHSHEYINREWSKYFEIISIKSARLDNHQDTILLRNR